MIMLTADAFGVLPPIARLTPGQAMYHFLSGFTAKVAGTEKGVGRSRSRLSPPASARPSCRATRREYGNLLRDLIASPRADCWLVNTGWTGGAFGTGRRMPIQGDPRCCSMPPWTAAGQCELRIDPHFGFRVPVAVPGVTPRSSNPRETWADKAAYDAQARKLVGMFAENFAKFEKTVDPEVASAKMGAAA